jgi:zinc/manganese transport system substrate-binding protein
MQPASEAPNLSYNKTLKYLSNHGENMLKSFWHTLLAGFVLTLPTIGFAQPLNIVAAENFYGTVAQQIGGDHVQVKCILNNQNQDPHAFTVDPQTAQIISQADLVVYNGLGYDSWIEALLQSASGEYINVSQLVDKKEGDDPHIWYDPITMLRYANYLAGWLCAHDPLHANDYHKQLTEFQKSYEGLTNTVSRMRKQHEHKAIAATELVFGHMAHALGLNMRGYKLQLHVTHGIEPGLQDMQRFQNSLQLTQIKALIYNQQVNSALTDRLCNLAKSANIPVVGVTETQPTGETYVSWMIGQLENLDHALLEHHLTETSPKREAHASWIIRKLKSLHHAFIGACFK